MSDCQPVFTPMTPGLHLSSSMGPSTPEEIEEMQNIPYLNVVGVLNYLAVTTHPDIHRLLVILPISTQTQDQHIGQQ